MKKYNKFKVKCVKCKAQFFMKLAEGRDFGEPNYKLYGRPPLTCPKCGFQENSDFNHHDNSYFFRNFENMGHVVEDRPGEQAPGEDDSGGSEEEKKSEP